jgi:putative two-component system response regulator
MILIVDDQPSNIDILLETIGDETEAAVALDGEEALEILEEEKPNLILLDIMMPGMNGFEVCRKIKENPGLSSIPVVFLSGNNSEEDIRTGMSLGAAGFLGKPINPVKVQEIISKYGS